MIYYDNDNESNLIHQIAIENKLISAIIIILFKTFKTIVNGLV